MNNAQNSWSTPSVDIYTSDAELLVHADLPGVKSDDVQVSFHEGTLNLEATRTVAEHAHIFRRKFRVEERLDDRAIRAELKDGVLTVHLPKAPKAEPRAIPVSVA